MPASVHELLIHRADIVRNYPKIIQNSSGKIGKHIDVKIAENYQGLPQSKIYFTDYFQHRTNMSTSRMKSRSKTHNESNAKAMEPIFT